MSKTLKQIHLVKLSKSHKKGGKSKSKIIRKKRQNITRKYGGEGEIQINMKDLINDTNTLQDNTQIKMDVFNNNYEIEYNNDVYLAQNPPPVENIIKKFKTPRENFLRFIRILRNIYIITISGSKEQNIMNINEDTKIRLNGISDINIYDWISSIQSEFAVLREYDGSYKDVHFELQLNNDDLIKLILILNKFKYRVNNSNKNKIGYFANL